VPRKLTKSRGVSTVLLAIGIIIMFIGMGVMLSSGVQLPLLSTIQVETPAASVTIEDISEEAAITIGVGAIITSFGLVLTIAGAVKK